MNALEIHDLTKRYPAFTLDHLTLTLPMGRAIGLIGENGAGKSTTIKLILGMLRRDEGSIQIFGKNIDEDLTNIKEDIGVVLDEVGIPGCLTPMQVGQIMKHTFRQWNSEQYARLLNKLSLPSDKQFKDFSRGMKMKLGIAVAMSHDAKLLILDEATSGLDPVVRDEVVEMLADYVRDGAHSILISSHIVSDLEKLCDDIAFVHDGKLLLCETKQTLLEDYGVVKGSIDDIPAQAILRRRDTLEGASALVRRSMLAPQTPINSISIEDLFLYMVKEVR